MSQMISNLVAGSSTNGVLLSANGAKAEGMQEGALSFNKALIAMMLSNSGNPQEAVAQQAVATLGLVETAGDSDVSSSLDELLTMVENLLLQLDDLDQLLVENEGLLESVQSWLLGLQTTTTTLQLDAAGAKLDSSQQVSELSPLANHPETMRFAVQDALVQLVQHVNETKQLAGQHQPAMAQAQQFVEALSQMLGATRGNLVTGEQPYAGTTLNSALAFAFEKTVENLLANSSRTLSGHENSQSGTGFSVRETNVQNASFQVTTRAMATAAGAQTITPETSSQVESLLDVDHGLHSGQTVTAGQLALREVSTASSLKAPAPSVPVEQFAKEMSGFLVNKFEIVKQEGMSQARISLYPEHLGQVDVRITMQNGQIVAQFVTEHAFARESLEAQMAQLRSALQAQGLQVNKLEVTQNTSLSSHMYHEDRQQGSGTNQQQQSSKRREVRDEDLLAIADISEEWNEWISEVRSREENYGSSFVARA